MKKTILTVCIALTIFMCNSVPVSAAICNGSPDGVHHFWAHQRQYGTEYSVSVGTHKYIYGYDAQNKPIYQFDCEMKNHYQYCKYICSYCGIEQDGVLHSHYTSTSHSVNHN